jgi:hypothetical protein
MHSFALSVACLFIGALLGSWFKTFQQRIDHQIGRFDDMVVEVLSLQGLVQEYWVKSRNVSDEPEQFEKLEAEIKGRFLLLNILFSSVREILPRDPSIDISKLITEFWENATSGSFGDNERPKELIRVQRVYRTGGLLAKLLRDTKAKKLISPPERLLGWLADKWAWISFYFK